MPTFEISKNIEYRSTEERLSLGYLRGWNSTSFKESNSSFNFNFKNNKNYLWKFKRLQCFRVFISLDHASCNLL